MRRWDPRQPGERQVETWLRGRRERAHSIGRASSLHAVRGSCRHVTAWADLLPVGSETGGVNLEAPGPAFGHGQLQSHGPLGPMAPQQLLRWPRGLAGAGGAHGEGVLGDRRRHDGRDLVVVLAVVAGRQNWGEIHRLPRKPVHIPGIPVVVRCASAPRVAVDPRSSLVAPRVVREGVRASHLDPIARCLAQVGEEQLRA